MADEIPKVFRTRISSDGYRYPYTLAKIVFLSDGTTVQRRMEEFDSAFKGLTFNKPTTLISDNGLIFLANDDSEKVSLTGFKLTSDEIDTDDFLMEEDIEQDDTILDNDIEIDVEGILDSDLEIEDYSEDDTIILDRLNEQNELFEMYKTKLDVLDRLQIVDGELHYFDENGNEFSVTLTPITAHAE